MSKTLPIGHSAQIVEGIIDNKNIFLFSLTGTKNLCVMSKNDLFFWSCMKIQKINKSYRPASDYKDLF